MVLLYLKIVFVLANSEEPDAMPHFVAFHLSCHCLPKSLVFKGLNYDLSYDVASGSEITPCNKIDKPLVVYRFSGNVMTSITTLCT